MNATKNGPMLSLAMHAPGRPVVHVCDDIARTAGPMIAAAIEGRILKRGVCRLGLSGGSTPGPVHSWLRDNLPAAWYEQLLITWVDERHLPLDAPSGPGQWQSFHADSNLRAAYETWLADAPISAERVLPMSLGGAIERQVLRFGRTFLSQFAGGLDIAILGAGPDGHIASLFPDHPGLLVNDVCMAIHDSPKPPAQRITLSMNVLAQADFVFVLASGEGKAGMLKRALDGDDGLPLSRLQPTGDDGHAGAYHWILDKGAASAIVATLNAQIGAES